MITLTLPSNIQKTFRKESVSIQDVAESISNSLAKEVLVANANGQIIDTNYAIPNDSKVNILTWKDDEGKNAFWHTSAHLLGAALQELYPGIQLGTGPAIENGFYYDVDFGEYKFTDADFSIVENKILELAQQKSLNVRREISKTVATAFFTQQYNPYKLELIEGLADGTITFYETGNFTDLCAGPHIPNTSLIKAVKLTAISGAYWRANEKNKMLTRVYGISFPNKLYLGRTVEYTKTHNYVPMLEGRSSIGRLGMFIHVTAEGYWTLEIFVIQPLIIYPNIEVCQIYYHAIDGEFETYTSGKYQKNDSIQPSYLFKDFENDN